MKNNCKHINVYNISEGENFLQKHYYYIDECIDCKAKITRTISIEDKIKEEN